MSRKLLIAAMGLAHRASNEDIETVEVRLTNARTMETTLQLSNDAWVNKNCSAEMIRAIDEIERGWILRSNGTPQATVFKYAIPTDKVTGDKNIDPTGRDLELYLFLGEFERERKLESPLAWRDFVNRFKDGHSNRMIDRQSKQRKGRASENILFILKMYCKKRGWNWK